MARGGMLDVVLADDDGEADGGRVGSGPSSPWRPAGPGGPAGDARPGRRRRGPTRRRWRRVGAAVVLAAMTAGAVQAGRADERADDRATRLADHPRVLAPLDGPLRELWRAPGGADHTVTTDGDLVVATFLTADGHVLVGTDATTGAERWSAPLPEVSNTRDLACVSLTADDVGTVAARTEGPDGQDGPDAGRGAGGGGPTHVVCRLVTALASLADGGQGFAASRLVVLDARTGARVDERPLTSRYSTLAVAGSELLLVELLRDGHGGIMREDPVTGHVLWTFRTEDPLPDVGDGPPALTAQVQRDLVVADGPGGWVLTTAGALRGAWLPRGTALVPGVRRAVDVTVLPDGRFAVTDATAEADGALAPGVVTTSATRDGFTLPGRVLEPVVDDGSAPGVLLTVPVGAGQVVALDVASGRELWRAEIRVGGQAVLLDGLLIVMSGRDVHARDVRTGDLVWRGPRDVVPSSAQLLTDGDLVLVPVLLRGAGPALVALGARDGGERWRVPMPAGVRELEVSDGRLLALQDRETVAFG